MFLEQLQKEQSYVKLRTTEEKAAALSYTNKVNWVSKTMRKGILVKVSLQ